MYSMTGYGKAEYNENGIDLVVEIKTVNNRNFDFNAKMPRIFIAYEDALRKVVAEYVTRGRIDLFVTFSDKREDASALELDIAKARSYFQAAETLSNEFGIINDVTASSLMRFPDVLTEKVIKDASVFENILLSTVRQAAENLNLMRKTEGEKLIADMLNRMDYIKELRDKIAERAPLVVTEYSKKLSERIAAALEGVAIDENRLLNEVAFFTDKANIDEELTRLSSHITQFIETVKKENSGKKLDFLMQEFIRESNTICSKSNDVSVTKYALALKNEIEKVREQVQNIE